MSAWSPDEVEERRASIAAQLGEEVTLDALTADFRMFQRRRGHRHSTDDFLTAWYAATHAPPCVSRMLDLGSGIGSVGIPLLWYFRDSTLTAVEVQNVSYYLLLQNIWVNDVANRTNAIHGDLRSVMLDGEFDLVLGSPPYFDPKNGIVSQDSQRAHARFELRGDVTDYCRVARRALGQEGRFIFCFPTAQNARAERACAESGLRILTLKDVVPKRGCPPLFTLYCCCRAQSGDEAALRKGPDFIVRDEGGKPTEAREEARALFGLTSRSPSD